jgi:hypothetical protein
MDDPVLIGEVHTAILQHSSALRVIESERLVDLVAGERPIVYSRPIPYVRSPTVLVGVDCAIVGASGNGARAVGTVGCRATVTSGRVVQGSSLAHLCRVPDGRRRPWPTYLSRPGTLQANGGAATMTEVGSGFLTAATYSGVNLSAVSERMIDVLQRSRLDRRSPLKVPRTRLRWYAKVGPGPRVHYAVRDAALRTVQLVVPGDQMQFVRGFCEDLALHDWLLGCVSRVLDGTPGGDSPQQLYRRLRPLVDHIVHLWMPVARPRESMETLWDSVDRASGMTRQWHTMVGRVRDVMNTNAVALLDEQADGALE